MSDIKSIIYDLLSRSGYDPDDGVDFDIDNLSGKVDGLVISQQSDTRSNLASLLQVFRLQFADTNGLLRIKPIDPTIVLTLNEADLIAIGDTNKKVVEEIIRGEAELPKQVILTYLDESIDFQENTQSASRISTNTQNTKDINFSLTLSNDQARQICDILLYDAWVTRKEIRFKLTNTYQYLEVGDVISLALAKSTGTWKIIEITRDIIHLEIKASRFDADIYHSKSVGASVEDYTNNLPLMGTTKIFLLDIPIINNINSDLGFYIVSSTDSINHVWTQGLVYESKDQEETYQPLSLVSNLATYGVCSNVLQAAPIANTWDTYNFIEVDVTLGELESKSKFSILNGANLALIGSELIQFQNVELISDNKYRLTTLLRGRFGTEHLSNSHTAGESFILLDFGSFTRITQSLNDLYKERKYKGVVSEGDLPDVVAQTFTNNANSHKPYSVTHVKGVRDSNQNLNINWKRRVRLNGDWVDNIDVPLVEENELYTLEIMQNNTIIRSINNITLPNYIYTSEMQILDFGSTQNSVKIRIFQISSLIGKGTVKEVIL